MEKQNKAHPWTTVSAADIQGKDRSVALAAMR
jgi:hypothetical protein